MNKLVKLIKNNLLAPISINVNSNGITLKINNKLPILFEFNDNIGIKSNRHLFIASDGLTHINPCDDDNNYLDFNSIDNFSTQYLKDNLAIEHDKTSDEDCLECKYQEFSKEEVLNEIEKLKSQLNLLENKIRST
ncbi:MAG: hypothetical protein [Bacteriophage sp.]|nr:MAG: hypothetical protein [Bacteriophage sp.]